MIFRRYMLTLLFIMALPITVQAEQFELPPDDDDVVGALTVVNARADETLLDLARRHGLGYEDIVRANPEVDTWLPGEGTEVLLPTRYVLPPGPRKGVILNLAEYRMYYFPEPKDGEPAIVMTYPMSIGRMDWETPLGLTHIVSKVRNPTWYPPDSVRAEHAANGDPLPRIVPPGPKNPLGAFAMRLGLPGYLIHSTNRPAGVGMRVTHGCIRMFPEDIRFLFDQVSVNTPVRIINQPVKIGWHGDELVMEVHRALEFVPFETDSGEISNEGLPEDLLVQPERNILTALTEQFVAATNTRAGELDWERAEDLLERADGIPMPVGRTIKNAATSAASE
ncbi:MAG: L,D-transpeptidase family protein [Proteobacteria bacterium]|nr:L,D-transpeptidase family protein [Pseudomonadota bacterium]